MNEVRVNANIFGVLGSIILIIVSLIQIIAHPTAGHGLEICEVFQMIATIAVIICVTLNCSITD